LFGDRISQSPSGDTAVGPQIRRFSGPCVLRAVEAELAHLDRLLALAALPYIRTRELAKPGARSPLEALAPRQTRAGKVEIRPVGFSQKRGVVAALPNGAASAEMKTGGL